MLCQRARIIGTVEGGEDWIGREVWVVANPPEVHNLLRQKVLESGLMEEPYAPIKSVKTPYFWKKYNATLAIPTEFIELLSVFQDITNLLSYEKWELDGTDEELL